MDDIAGKISELLSSPDGMEKIKSMAQALFSDKGNNSDNSQEQHSNVDSGGFSLPDGIDPVKIMGILSALNNTKTDQRSALLLALKPHLSEEKQQRVDRAVGLLKMASILPVLKEQGILDIL